MEATLQETPPIGSGSAAGEATAPPARPTNPLKLIWQALWFQDSAFAEVRDSDRPLLRGLIIAVILSVVAGVSGALGLGFNRLISPDLKEVKATVFEGLQAMPWYTDLASGPNGAVFEQRFLKGYEQWWQIAPSLLRFPTLQNAASALCLTPVVGLIRWAIIGTLTYLAARLLGGKGGFGQTLGVMALAYAPQLVSVLMILPGLEAGRLTGWWTLALTYWAVRSVHGLSWRRNLLAAILPGLIVALVASILVAIGVVAGFALFSAQRR